MIVAAQIPRKRGINVGRTKGKREELKTYRASKENIAISVTF